MLKKPMLLIFSILGLAACSSTQTTTEIIEPTRYLLATSGGDKSLLFHQSNQHFLNKAIEIETPEQIFALNDEAIGFVTKVVNSDLDDDGKVRALINHIFDRADLDMLYSATANTSAAETYETGYANCLSLTILSYAMTQRAGLKSHFQRVNIPEFWTRREGSSLINGHINLRVMVDKQFGIQSIQHKNVIVDFDTQIRRRGFTSTDVSKERITAMFYNNKGAELLLKKDNYNAYRFISEAVKTDARFSDAWVNLGLLYRRLGEYSLAESVYELAAQLDKKNLTALDNLAYLYEFQGLNDKAEDVRSKLQSRRQRNPFYHMMLGEIAYEENQYALSIRHFNDAISIDREQHLFYFGLAKAHYASGDKKLAQRYLKRAKRNSLDDELSDLYASKLQAINLGTH